MKLILFLLIFLFPTNLFAKKIYVYYAGFSYLVNNESQFSGMPLTTLLTKEKKGNQNTVDFAITDKLKKNQS